MPRSAKASWIGPGGERRDHRVRGGQDPGPRAEVRVQGELVGRGAVGLGEPPGELEQVEQARPAPLVDVLVRVTHGGHREAAPEDAGDQVRLGHVRVLVLVQEDRPIPRAVVQADVGEALHDLEGLRDLVAEVDDPQVLLQPLEPRHGPGQLDALERRPVRLVALVGSELLEPRPVEGDDLVRRDPVIGHLFGEQEDRIDQRGLPFGLHVFEGHLVEDPRAQLGPLGGREDALTGLDAGQQAVSLEDLRRELVVVHHRGLLALLQLDGRQRPANAQREVLGGLDREGQAQHVPGKHAAPIRGHPAQRHQRQVDDPGGHHRRLAGARAGHDHTWLERHRDGPPLLLGGVRPQGVPDLRRHRGGVDRSHRATPCRASAIGKTSLPSGNNGHRVLKSQKRQFAPGSGR